MNLIGEPAAINRMATILDQKAEQLSSIGRRLHDRAERSRGRWECAKADRFRDSMEGRQRQAEGMAQDLRSLAGDLRRIAIQVQNQINDLNAFERRVRSLLSSAEHGAEWALERGVDVARLPARTDPAWESIARAPARSLSMRILIDTDELRSMSSDLRSIAHELGDVNLELVRGWACTAAPPPQLVSCAARGSYVQARSAALAASISFDSLACAAEATGAETRDSAVHDWRRLTSYLSANRGPSKGAGARGLSALRSLRSGLASTLSLAWYGASHPGATYQALAESTNRVFRETDDVKGNTLLAIRLLKTVSPVGLATDALVLATDTIQLGFTGITQGTDSAAYAAREARRNREALDIIPGAASLALTGGTINVTKLIDKPGVGLALIDRFFNADLTNFVKPSHSLPWIFNQVVHPPKAS